VEPMRFQEWPLVTIQLPVFNEPEVVVRLLQAVAQIRYPAERLQIQVLDDSTDGTTALCAEQCQTLKARGLEIEHQHRVNREGFKAGALAAGLRAAKGEFIAIFDADFLPEPDFLEKTIHHFTDESVAVVQARWGHLNRKSNLLTRLQAILLDGHLLLEQTSRSRSGEFCNFNGTAGVWRRRAIEEAGGWTHDTLTEDLDLSYRAQLLGWRFVYLKDLVVLAELPMDMAAFKSQQHRWTKGSVQVCRKILGTVWRSDKPLAHKVEATAHLGVNFVNLLTLCTLALMYPVDFAINNSISKVLLVDLPVFLLATVSVATFYLAAQGVQTRWGWLRALPLVPLAMALGVGMSVNNSRGVLEALLGQKSDFVRTPKTGASETTRGTRSAFSANHLILWVEVAFVLYFGWLVWLAIEAKQWGSLPFLFLFLGGFLYVCALPSLRWARIVAVRVSAGMGALLTALWSMLR